MFRSYFINIALLATWFFKFVFWMIKKFKSHKDCRFCKCYFTKNCKNIDITLDNLMEVINYLEKTGYADEQKCIENNIKNIYFFRANIDPKWFKNGDIALTCNEDFSENFLYLLGLLLLFANCIQFKKQSSTMSESEINEIAMNNLLDFLRKLDLPTEEMEKYFEDNFSDSSFLF